jgi:hypothetical protein
MELQEIREMLQLMDKFVDAEPLNIITTEELSDEEITHIKISQKAMRKERKKFFLKTFAYEE